MSILRWIKKEVLFAEHMSNKELFILFISMALLTPIIYFCIVGVFALGYMLQG